MPSTLNRAGPAGHSASSAYSSRSIAAAVIALALFDWNNARGWIAQKVKDRTGRDLVIGELRVRPFSLHPKIHAGDVTLSNAEWGEKTPMIEADTVDFSVSLLPLIFGRVVFPDVALGEASVLLQRDREGRRNWVLKPEEEKTGEPVQIRRLTVNKGQLAFKDVLSDTEPYGQAADHLGRALRRRGLRAGQGEGLQLQGDRTGRRAAEPARSVAAISRQA